MSFNRPSYDKEAYDLQINRSTEPGNYRLYASFAERQDSCFSFNGPPNAKSDVSLVRQQTNLSNNDMAQIESDLSWRNQKLSKTNNNRNPLDNSKLINKNVCGNILVSEDTRFTHPLDNYRGMSLTPYFYEPYIPINLQCHIQDNRDRQGLNSRIAAKDAYVLKPQTKWDDGTALPLEKSCKPPVMEQIVWNPSAYLKNIC
jgi:hypothetical protein